MASVRLEPAIRPLSIRPTQTSTLRSRCSPATLGRLRSLPSSPSSPYSSVSTTQGEPQRLPVLFHLQSSILKTPLGAYYGREVIHPPSGDICGIPARALGACRCSHRCLLLCLL